MAKKAKNKNKNVPKEATEIPEFFDADQQLKTLKSSDFPRTREGQMAYCDFQIEKWGVKKVAISIRLDPMAKKKKRRERLLEQLKKLEEELGPDEDEKTDE